MVNVKRLKDILKDVEVLRWEGGEDREVKDMHFDSRKVGQNCAFVAIPGTQTDGHQFIDMAIAKGADTIICERLPEQLNPNISYVQVANAALVLSLAMANFLDRPADHLQIIGVTGTNGKSSTVTMLHAMFNALGLKSGLISTIHYLVGEEEFPATHTTPDARQLQLLFAKMVEAGCEYCFMEVSSHALVQNRTAGIQFQQAIFSNITHDHIGYHGTFAEYIRAKKILFDQLGKESTAIVNVDDKNGRIMVQNSAAKVVSYACKRMADYRVKVIENAFEGLHLHLDGQEAFFRLIGSFNAYNLLAVYASARELGLEKAEILTYLSSFGGVAGRFEVVRSEKIGIVGIVDYAHTPDALKNVLSTIADINQGKQQVIALVGCGGNRDKAKRPKMAAIGAQYADQLIITSDNPRDEDPEVILDEMEQGIPMELKRKVLRIENRAQAIRTACKLASVGDIVLVAGKGNEDYQEIKGVKHPFDDRKLLRQTYKDLGL